MSGADLAVDELVALVRQRAAGTNDAAAFRAAFAAVLSELDVTPGDPAWTDGRDVIGAAYERLLRGRERRPLGQFFTPLSIGRAMAAWLLEPQPRLLLDPASGSGSLLVAAAHERSGETAFAGVDIDPLAIRMVRENATLRQIEKLSLRVGNFLTDEFTERPEALICNPPFTRHQALTRDEKVAIHQGFTDRLGLAISQLASLHVLFLLRALEVTADDARLAFITPAHWLDMNYGRAVKEYVLEHAQVEAIVHFPARELIFEHAATTAAITLIRKRQLGEPSVRTRVVQARSTSREDIVSAFSEHPGATFVELSSREKWSRSKPRRRGRMVRLEELARVRRGAATGCNAFFVLSEEERRWHRLNRCLLRPCAASPRWFDTDEITEETLAALPDNAPRWLLYPTRERLGGPLERYLQRADALGVHERYLVRQRVAAGRRWWEVEDDFEAPILFTYLNRSRPRFVRNLADAIPLNNWLAIEPFDGVDAGELFAALQRATADLRQNAREYGNGLWKLEPSELRRFGIRGL